MLKYQKIEFFKVCNVFKTIFSKTKNLNLISSNPKTVLKALALLFRFLCFSNFDMPFMVSSQLKLNIEVFLSEELQKI